MFYNSEQNEKKTASFVATINFFFMKFFVLYIFFFLLLFKNILNFRTNRLTNSQTISIDVDEIRNDHIL